MKIKNSEIKNLKNEKLTTENNSMCSTFIDIKEVIEIAGSIRNDIKDMNTCINEADKAVKVAISLWNSDASKYIKGKWPKELLVMKQHTAKTENYSHYLEDAAGIMERVEATITKSAEDSAWM